MKCFYEIVQHKTGKWGVIEYYSFPWGKIPTGRLRLFDSKEEFEKWIEDMRKRSEGNDKH